MENDDARWFDGLGRCRCGKPANGHVMGSRNQKMEVSCEKCALKRLAKARKERGEK